MKNIPYLDLKAVTAQHIDEIQSAVAEVVNSGWYLQGECVRQFEQHFAQYTGYEHCIGVANGLDALTLTLKAYKEMGLLEDGDEVLVPANTFIATVLAITDNRLTPVLVEPRFSTLEIDDERVEKTITPRTKALMLVHLYGRNAWTPRLKDVCEKHNLIIIEDCAQAHGLSSHKNSTALTSENCKTSASCYSFYPGKNLGALGDAGAVVTNDEQLARTLRCISNYGFSRRYVADNEGRNSRLDEIQAAILDVKLRYLDEDNKKRQELAHIYYKSISNPCVELPALMCDDDNVYHIFPVFCKHRDALQKHLSEHGIGTLIHYPVPPHRQRCYPQLAHCQLPVTERIAAEELSLPLNQTMSMQDVEYVAMVLNAFNPLAL